MPNNGSACSQVAATQAVTAEVKKTAETVEQQADRMNAALDAKLGKPMQTVIGMTTGAIRSLSEAATDQLAPDAAARFNGHMASLAAQTERFTGADLEDLVRRAGLAALRRVGGEVSAVEARDFDTALKDSRATVTVEMEEEYLKMRGELKKRAAAVQPIGFLSPDMLTPTREKKHD